MLRYVLISLVPVAVLGLAVELYTRSEARRSVTEQAQREALTLVQGGIEPVLELGGYANGSLSEDARRALADSTDGDGAGHGADRVLIWTTKGRLVFDGNDPGASGRLADFEQGFFSAVAGDASSGEIEDSSRTLRVFAPVRLAAGDEVVAVAELSMPLDQSRPDSAHGRLRTVLMSAVALLWLFLGLLTTSVTKSLRRSEAEHRHLALYDPLTGLPNRRHFTEEAGRTLALLAEHQQPAAVVLLDLVGFTQINNAIGREHGDELLRYVSGRLAAMVQPGQVLGRLGGDVFGLLLPGVDSAAAMKQLGVIRAVLETETEVAGIPVSFEAAIGVASFPADGVQLATVLQRADIAMEAAKTRHVEATAYSAELDDAQPAKLGLAVELRRAIANHELFLVYQPKVHLADRSVHSVEALVRWNHPERGMVSPAEFIPVAEATGLIVPLTEWVLDAAVQQGARWVGNGLGLRVAINVSAKNVRDDRFPDLVMRCLLRHGLAPERIELEITETAIVTDPLRVARTVRRLREAGVAVALDDFGQGSTSLAHLRDLPLSTLKIDKSFIDDLCVDPVDAAIVYSTIGLGHALGLEVVAEGVETADQYATLEAWGCDVVQGFYCSRPLTVEQIAERFNGEPHGESGGGSGAHDDGHPMPAAGPVGSDGGDLVGLGGAVSVGGATA